MKNIKYLAAYAAVFFGTTFWNFGSIAKKRQF